jgi:hypothetical protein
MPDKTTKTAYELIADERQRQLRQGFHAAHDDKHENGELADAAACYAAIVGPIILGASPGEFDASNFYFAQKFMQEGHLSWPFEPEVWSPTEDPIRMCVKAGALIIAEIERLQREFA